MSDSTSISVDVTNKLDVELVVFSTMSASPQGQTPSTDPNDYYPVYTKLGTVPANGQQSFDTKESLPRLVLARSSDAFPVKLFVGQLLGPTKQAVTVDTDDQSQTESAFTFFKNHRAQPYAPASVQFNEILLDTANIPTLEKQVADFFNKNGYSGVTYGDFTIVAYWAANSLYAWPGTYYCYEPSQPSSGGYILPTTSVGTLKIGSGSASFQAQDGGTSYDSLSFAKNKLSSSGASSGSGISLTAIVRDMSWEGQSDKIEMFFVGKRDGKQMIVQPYEKPQLPWWVAAYNLAFLSFQVVQVAMLVDMAKHVLQGLGKGVKWLADNAKSFYQKIRGNTEADSAEADPDAEVGDDVDPINVDTDVDVDVDVDVVTDTDNVTDTDVDVDIDIDVDIDEDVFSVVDVDVDVDVDIDTDVVTDTDNVTDTDTDVDTDVDTNVDVQPGGIKELVSKVGRWVMTKGMPALAKNLVIMGAMTGAQKLLEAWKNQDQQDLKAMSPQESTGLGLLLNYMLNDKNPVSERWTTMADYVQQQQPSVQSQQMLMASLLMFKNDAADTALHNWTWPKEKAEDLASQMAQNKAAPDQYKAYQTLANYTYDGKTLPVKVGAGVAIKFLSKVG